MGVLSPSLGVLSSTQCGVERGALPQKRTKHPQQQALEKEPQPTLYENPIQIE